jgi:hypothetical protein
VGEGTPGFLGASGLRRRSGMRASGSVTAL